MVARESGIAEAERSVLSAAMLSKDAASLVFEELREADFYHRHHRTLCQALRASYDEGESLDPITVTHRLRRKGQLEDAGGVMAVSEVFSQEASAANVRTHLKIVKEASLERETRDLGRTLAAAVERSDTHIEEVLDTHWQALVTLQEGHNTKGGWQTMESTLGEAAAEYDKAKACDKPYLGMDTGFENINRAMGGFLAPDLFVLAARPSQGKSAIAVQMAQAVAQSGKAVAFFSLEMSALQIIQRMVCSDAGVDLFRYRNGGLAAHEEEDATSAMSRLHSLPLHIDDTAGITINECRARAMRLCRQYDVGLIVVDYLQLMRAPGADVNSRVQEVGMVSRGLKAMAKELHTPVLALSQLSRAVESRSDKKPQLSDLRESGEVEQDADIVAAIYRPGYYGLNDASGAPIDRDFAQLLILKQRSGPLGGLDLRFHAEAARFEELAPEYRNATPEYLQN